MNAVILTASNSRNAGGVSEAIKQLASRMQMMPGLNLSILSYNDEYSKEDLSSYEPIQMDFYRVSHNPLLRSIGYSTDIHNSLDILHPDIIDSQGLWMYHSFAAINYKKKNRIKTIITPHGMLDAWAINNSRWKKRVAGFLYENSNLQQADCIKALCLAEYHSIRDYGLRNPIAIIPNGITLPQFTVYSSPLNQKKRLLFLGRIHPKKGLKELLIGLTIVKKARPDLLSQWEIRIAGWDQDGFHNQLVDITKETDLEDCVRFIGPVFGDSKAEELKQATAFILPSFSEGLPMSILEAWSYHLPVLMTEQCNLPEGFSSGAAIKVGHDPESIANGILSLFNLSQKAMGIIGENGFNLVKTSFSWDIIALKTTQLYEWVLNGGDKPDFVITE